CRLCRRSYRQFRARLYDPGRPGSAGLYRSRLYAPAAAERRMTTAAQFGVFLPVANGGWIVSRNTPLLDGGWTQNRDAALIAEAEGLDFVMSMGKWRGFGG